MSIKQAMTTGIAVVSPEETIQSAAHKMSFANVGFLPVCNGDRIVGVVTDRDLAIRATAVGKAPDTLVRDVMTEDVVYCFDDDDVERVARVMKEREIRRVIVVDRNKRLVGIVALGDLAETVPGQSADVLEAVSEAPPQK